MLLAVLLLLIVVMVPTIGVLWFVSVAMSNEQLASQHANFTYVPALNEPSETDQWQGFVGFVHQAAAAHFEGKFKGHKAYLCGPPLMIDAAITTLMQGRLFEQDIHMEKFFTAADGAEDAQRSALFKRI